MPAGDREGERKRDSDGDGEREICHPRKPVGDRERERKRESTGILGIPAKSLSVSGQRERPRVGFSRIRPKT